MQRSKGNGLVCRVWADQGCFAPRQHSCSSYLTPRLTIEAVNRRGNNSIQTWLDNTKKIEGASLALMKTPRAGATCLGARMQKEVWVGCGADRACVQTARGRASHLWEQVR